MATTRSNKNLGVSIIIQGSKNFIPYNLTTDSVIMVGTLGTPGDDDNLLVEFPIGKTTLITGQNYEEALAGSGSLPDQIGIYFGQANTAGIGMLFVHRVAVGATEPDTIAAVADAVRRYDEIITGIGSRPGIVLAPGWTHQREGGFQNPVAAEMEATLPAHLTLGIVDVGDSAANHEDAIAYAETCSSRFVTGCWPWVRYTRKATYIPASGLLAGLYSVLEVSGNGRDSRPGPHLSAIQMPVRLVDGLSQVVSSGTPSSIATLMMKNAVTAFAPGENSGYICFGDETFETTDTLSFSVANTRLLLNVTRNVKITLRTHILGRPISDELYQFAESQVRIYLEGLVRQGWMRSFVFTRSQERSPENDAIGLMKFDLKINPHSPCKEIEVFAELAIIVTESREG